MGQITAESRNGLIKKLGLPPLDCDCQDWEIEVANSSLVDKLLNEYTKREDLGEDEKFTLMYIIIESASDYLTEYKKFHQDMNLLKNIIMDEYILHRETILDYACFSLSLEHAWDISPYMRSIVEDKDKERLQTKLNYIASKSDFLNFLSLLQEEYWVDGSDIELKTLNNFFKAMNLNDNIIKKYWCHVCHVPPPKT